MTATFGTAGQEVYLAKRFLDDKKRLGPAIARKVNESVTLLMKHGPYYPRFETRKIAGNPNSDYRFLDVDDQYRMVGVLLGRNILLEKVGNHDETLRWGAAATLDEYAERVLAADVEFGGRRRKADDEPSDVLFDTVLAAAEIVTSPVLSDVITIADERILEGWDDGTIEDWMIFLSPVQRRAVDRAVSGPARVTGGPGTGKTVVALHRAAQFARQVEPGQRVLLTSFVNTVPAVLQGLFERLAPDAADRIEARTVHSIATGLIDHREHAPIEQNAQAKARFNRCLASNGPRQRQLVAGARLGPDYLFEEVTRVIEGRGVPDLETYLELRRHGRRRQLPAMIRRLVWELYEEYRAACANPKEPILSWEQVLQAALDAATADGGRRYAAIVVDEAQDITETGMRLLVALLEGGQAGRILVVGDAGQRIYHGGWRLADLGLEIRGRSFSLAVCYRSTDEIMRAVGALGQTLSTEEFGEDGLRSLATSTVRSGPRPILKRFTHEGDEIAWILDQLDPDDPALDGTAILAYATRAVDDWLGRLTSAGIGGVNLRDYRGRPVPGVKVGTFHRAKGLEFERVFLPGLSAIFPFGDRNDDDLLTQGSALYVAMSRARDRLLMSHTGAPTMFLEHVAAFCDPAVDPEPEA